MFEEYAAGLAVEDHQRLYLKPHSEHGAQEAAIPRLPGLSTALDVAH
jgi:hypothetical protein